jgi:anti-sigma factor RsiW
VGVLQQLLDPLLFGGAPHYQVGPVAGQVPQPSNLRWRHEAWPQHLPLGDLAQPDRVQPVGLGPPGEVLDVTSVDQPDLEAVGLQQIEGRLPVVAGGSMTTRVTPSSASRSASTSSERVIVW